MQLVAIIRPRAIISLDRCTGDNRKQSPHSAGLSKTSQLAGITTKTLLLRGLINKETKLAFDVGDLPIVAAQPALSSERFGASGC